MCKISAILFFRYLVEFSKLIVSNTKGTDPGQMITQAQRGEPVAPKAFDQQTVS